MLDRKTYNGDVFGPGQFATVSVRNPVANQGYVDFVTTNYRATMENVHGFYVQDWLRISEKFKALAGLRYDISEVLITPIRSMHSECDCGRCTFNGSQGSADYRLGLVYQPIEILSVYGSYSTYFKPSRRVAANGETFDPENGYQEK